MVDRILTARSVEKALRAKIDPEKAQFYPRFFKAGKGEYAEGDRFLGVVVPEQRKIARRYRQLPIDEIQKLIDNPFHECRLTGILILVDHFESAESESARKKIYSYYLRNADRVNNWDLVDSSAHKIVGAYLLDKPHQPLFKLARARHLWKNRIAIIATLEFIKHHQFDTTLEISEALLNHPHDLIHKAVGWMLREIGKRNETPLLLFLDEHAPQMPRTMLRYAIENLSPVERKRFMAMKRK